MRLRCLSPKHLTNPYTKQLVVAPCGHCSACLQARADNWRDKMELERQSSKFAVFITLTYKEKFIPKYTVDEIGAMLTERELMTFDEVVKSSHNYLEVFKGLVRVPLVKEGQNFIKRLRENVRRNKNISEQEKTIRYVLVSEYGETGLRGHIHGVLYFESVWLANHIEKMVSSAWSSYNRSTRKRESLGRFTAEHIKDDACRYVASYCLCFASLPPILQTSKTRPWLISSKHPAIGSFPFTGEQIKKILSDTITTRVVRQPDTNKLVDVPFSSSFENALFPKCAGFSQLDSRSRLALYKLHAKFESSSQLLEYLRSKWETPVSELFYSPLVCRYVLQLRMGETPFPEVIPQSWYTAVSRALNISGRFLLSCSRTGFSQDKMLSCIEAYWKKKNYESLCSQLRFEEQVSNEYNTNNPLQSLLGLIDEAFYENERKLPPCTYQLYIEQFGVTDDFVDFRECDFFKQQKSRFDSFVFNGKSYKRNNEYLETHPHLKKLYA